MRRSWRLVGAAAVTATVLTACGGGDDSDAGAAEIGEITAEGEGISLNENGGQVLERTEPTDGGELVVGMIAPVETLDPLAQLGSPGQEVTRFVHDSLMNFDAEGNVVPDLTESLETTDDGTNWTMTLPTGVAFHDGTPFDAAAVVAHLDRIKAEGSTSSSAGDIRAIASYAAPDATTVTFTLPAPNMTFPTTFAPTGAAFAAAFVPSPTAYTALGAGYGSAPVGVGPFRVESFQPGGDIVLVANEDYRIEGLPYLDRLRFVTATDSQARLAAAQSGDIDIAMTQVSTDFARAEDGGLTVLRQPASTYYNLLFNMSQAPFDDPRFRQAVIQGIDLEGLDEAVFEGLQTPMTGIFPADHPFYVDTDWPAFDPEAARALVEEYTADTGNEPTFTLTTTSPPEFQRQAQIMQQMLADVGITMDIEVGDQPTMITEALSGNYQAQHRFIGVNAEAMKVLSVSFRSDLPSNIGQAGNPELDQLLDRARVTAPADRGPLLEDIQRVLREWLPFMPQIQHAQAFYVSDRVGGFPGSLPGTTAFDARQVWVQE
jgi:peptide/nickel transport system substrate-binding protein